MLQLKLPKLLYSIKHMRFQTRNVVIMEIKTSKEFQILKRSSVYSVDLVMKQVKVD